MDIMIFTIGIALVFAQGYTSGEFQTMWGLVYNTNMPSDPFKVKASTMSFFFQIAFIIILSIVSQLQNDMGKLILALEVALWIIWGFNNAATIGKFGKAMGLKTS